MKKPTPAQRRTAARRAADQQHLATWEPAELGITTLALTVGGAAWVTPVSTPVTGPAMARTILGGLAEQVAAAALAQIAGPVHGWPADLAYGPPVASALDPARALYPDLWVPGWRALVEVKGAARRQRRFYVGTQQLADLLWVEDTGGAGDHGRPPPLPGAWALYALVLYELPAAASGYRTAGRLAAAFYEGLAGVLFLPARVLDATLGEPTRPPRATPLSERCGGAYQSHRQATLGAAWAPWWADDVGTTTDRAAPHLPTGALGRVDRWVTPIGRTVPVRCFTPAIAASPWVGPLQGAGAALFRPTSPILPADDGDDPLDGLDF